MENDFHSNHNIFIDVLRICYGADGWERPVLFWVTYNLLDSSCIPRLSRLPNIPPLVQTMMDLTQLSDSEFRSNHERIVWGLIEGEEDRIKTAPLFKEYIDSIREHRRRKASKANHETTKS